MEVDESEDSPRTSEKTIDKVMGALIRLRMVVERAAAKGLFPYNAEVLLARLDVIESTYESNVTSTTLGKILL